MAKKRKKSEGTRVHPDLKGFSIDVDALGEIRMNRSLEEISQFLKTHMPPENLEPHSDKPPAQGEEE
ncbi:MAG: hypothetical protein K9I85_06215 [Saprospiraceae bacterium]|nr:hypothetical protein [Saprospiraceae bacterium]